MREKSAAEDIVIKQVSSEERNLVDRVDQMEMSVEIPVVIPVEIPVEMKTNAIAMNVNDERGVTQVSGPMIDLVNMNLMIVMIFHVDLDNSTQRYYT